MFLWFLLGVVVYVTIIMFVVAWGIAYLSRRIEKEPDSEKISEVKSIIKSMEYDLGYKVRLANSIHIALIKNLHLCFACVMGFSFIMFFVSAIAMLIMILTWLF